MCNDVVFVGLACVLSCVGLIEKRRILDGGLIGDEIPSGPSMFTSGSFGDTEMKASVEE